MNLSVRGNILLRVLSGRIRLRFLIECSISYGIAVETVEVETVGAEMSGLMIRKFR